MRIQGFNEAPIHESGKLGIEEWDEETKQGFNEAPIHESGKCGRNRDIGGEHQRLQ